MDNPRVLNGISYILRTGAPWQELPEPYGPSTKVKVDTWPVSIDVAMPTGLVVNEIMTNALKYAFEGRDGGTIKVSSLVDDTGCRVVMSDDGVGLPDGTAWPQAGRLGDAIAQSLKDNAKASIDVHSARDQGVKVYIFFARKSAEPH